MQISIEDKFLLGSEPTTLTVTVVQAQLIQLTLETFLVEQHSNTLAEITVLDQDS